MNHLKDRKPSRPDIQEILSRMKSRFSNEGDSDNDDMANEENMVTTSVVESTIKEEFSVAKSPDDEIAELMLKLNGQVDEELVASIRSRKKMYENQSEVDSTSTTNNSDETEQEKPRIILTLRPNENKPDSYVSSSNLTEYSSNSPKRKKQVNNVTPEVIPLKRSSRRSNNGNQSVLKSAIARKERTFSIDMNSKKKLPKKIKIEHEEVTNEVNVVPVSTKQPPNEKENKDIKYVPIKEEINEETITDHKKKKKKFFRGGRYNIFKKKIVQKERQKMKKAICNQVNSDLTNFDVDSSETNSERHSISVCSDIGTLMSSERNEQDDMDTSISTIDAEDKMNDSGLEIQEIHLCLCQENIQVVIVDEGKITCKAHDCMDGKVYACKNLASHLDEYGNMPMLRANVALPYVTYCQHHMRRFFLHHSCPRCGRFCSEGIFMMCKNKHFFHIGCHQNDRGCLHCGDPDVYDFELKKIVIPSKKQIQHREDFKSHVTVEVGKIKLSTLNCPPEIDIHEFSKYLQQLKDEIVDTKRTKYSVQGLYEACESNNIKRVLSILEAECNLMFTFPSNHNRTALHVACRQGNLMIVYILLKAGVDPNRVDNKMKSPMRMAAKSGHSDIVQYLIDFNGSPEIKDIQGMTSLHLAAKNGKLECCKIILNNQPSMVNWKDNGGWTPLVWACENSHIDVVKFFISFIPNTRISDDENNVALHWAAISGCLEVVQCLVEYDSEVNMLNEAGETALHIAARKNAVDIVSFLLDKGAMAWHRNKGKKRPIDLCLPNSKCYNILKNVLPEQRKPVTVIPPLNTVKLEYTELELQKPQTPIAVKTTPVLISEDITHGCEDTPIRCVNEIDDEVPVEFTYIKENCYDVGNYVDSAMSHIASCSCDGACNTNDCKCVQANGDCLYDENGRLNSDFDYFNPSVILYECNWRCRCHKQRCGNRVIQKGIKVKLELYKHKDMGWGVRTLQPISRGTFVCEYVGEIITDQKANDLKEDSYLFNLENPGATELYCIDAYNYSNVSRFINHSCDPNLMSVRSFINHHDKRFPRIAFFAVQDIKKNEQLSYDYGTTFWKVKGGLFTCKCSKANCSFSDETIDSLHIDSDNEEIEPDGNSEKSKTEKNELPDDKPLIQEVPETNKRVRNTLRQRTRLSAAINLLQQKTDRSSPSSSESSSVTVSSIKKNYSKEPNIISMPKNKLLGKTKTINLSSTVKNKESHTSESKQLLKVTDKRSLKDSGSKLIQDKLKQVVLKKSLGNKLSNGNSSPSISKKIFIGRKSSVETTEKSKICNGNKVTSGSTKLVNNKVIKNYVLRRKVLNPSKKNIANMLTDGTASNNVNKFSRLINNTKVIISSNTSSSNLKTTRDSKHSDQLIDFIKTERIGEESKTKSNIVNGQHKPPERPRTSVSEEVKVEPNDELYIINGCNDESFPHTD
ncbi:histone-lysine N-methyltransferase EHMT2 [Rhopalosiphum padi]|uniref:histone-lysine N-methyltransferase EHMT2 n=1 Tax=Rhopalosiphum padi TaxID=40932 RepID=UPI00298E6A6B|nr:histone-lysine N-methyltransferase EHMT2 [Rhopalosiphum padi]